MDLFNYKNTISNLERLVFSLIETRFRFRGDSILIPFRFSPGSPPNSCEAERRRRHRDITCRCSTRGAFIIVVDLGEDSEIINGFVTQSAYVALKPCGNINSVSAARRKEREKKRESKSRAS